MLERRVYNILIWFYWESDRERHDSMHTCTILTAHYVDVVVCKCLRTQYELEQNASNRWEWDRNAFTYPKWSYARNVQPKQHSLVCWCCYHEQHTAIITYIHTYDSLSHGWVHTNHIFKRIMFWYFSVRFQNLKYSQKFIHLIFKEPFLDKIGFH